MSRVLVTGGCGFIGSHLSLLLIEKNFDVTIIDSNQNSSPHVIEKIEYLAKLKNIFRKKKLTLLKAIFGTINSLKIFLKLNIPN